LRWLAPNFEGFIRASRRQAVFKSGVAQRQYRLRRFTRATCGKGARRRAFSAASNQSRFDRYRLRSTTRAINSACATGWVSKIASSIFNRSQCDRYRLRWSTRASNAAKRSSQP
jgi:hypothetical protein